MALGPHSGTRNSNDSGTTSIWSSSRSSFGTRESISTSTYTGSAGLTPSSTTSYLNFPFKPQSPGSAGPIRPTQRYQRDSGPQGIGSSFHRGSMSQPSTEQDTPGGDAERAGSLLLDLAKRPSYANFSAEVEKQRAEIQKQRSMAEAEEAWRRQSDNAAILSDERRRLLGSSPQPLPHRELQKSTEAALESAAPSIAEQISTLPDDAIRAARTRLLRYESYPFGSKDARSAAQGTIVPPERIDLHRRQSMFPHQAQSGIVASEMRNSIDHSDLAGNILQNTFSVGSGWREPQEQHHRSSTSSQRDMQFEDIVRKASIDLVKRSATSSLTGTPITASRTLVLPGMTSESAIQTSPATTLLQNRPFDAAEAANAREREQRQYSNPQISASPSAVASHSTTPRKMLSPSHSRSGVLPSPFTPTYAPYHDILPPLQGGGQGMAPPWANTDDLRRSSFQVITDATRPETLGRSHSQHRHSVPMDIDQQQMNQPRRSPLPNTVGQSVSSYAGPTTRHDRPYDLPVSWHRAHGAPRHDEFKAGESSRRRSHAHDAVINEGAVLPYYDNPKMSAVSGANDSPGFPSVLRNEVHMETNSNIPNFGGASNASRHESARPIPYHSNQPTPQQQDIPVEAHGLYNAWNPDLRMGLYTSLPPGPDRTMAAPLTASSTTLPGPRYTCDHCGKSFSRPSSLKIHIYSRE